MEPADLVPPSEHGRVFTLAAHAGLADVAPSGRARLDAVARWLQDAALGDVVDAGLQEGAWVLRRMSMLVQRFPRFGAGLEVATFCSGTGPMVAERRSTIREHGEVLVEAVAAWVHVDPHGGRPLPLPDGFEAVYGASANGRRVRARLRHPAEPPAGAAPRPWRFRAADLDLAGHVNNAVYWQVLEEELVGADPPAPLRVEVEHRAAALAGEATVRGADAMRWIADPGGRVLATLTIDHPAAGAP
jgi:acyl-ACP thioesterase